MWDCCVKAPLFSPIWVIIVKMETGIYQMAKGHELQQGELQIDKGENPLQKEWRDMEQGLRVPVESPSSEVVRA